MKLLFFGFLLFAYSSLHTKEVTIFLIRHGETDWNTEKRIQGHTDIPLNERGMAQAKNAAEKLSSEHADIIAIYSSDLSRAYNTAQATAEKLNLSVNIRPSLREIDCGSSEGMLKVDKINLYKKQWEELAATYPKKRDRWNHSPIPGEETITELIKRIKNEMIFISEIAPDKAKVAVFSHSKAIRAFIADIEDIEPDELEIPNCGIVEVLYNTENPDHNFSVNSYPFK